MAANTFWYGNNLDVLRERIAPESMDLISLDPPFNSNRSYGETLRGWASCYGGRYWYSTTGNRLWGQAPT